MGFCSGWKRCGRKIQFLNGKDVASKTAETAGVHISTVYKVLKEYKTEKRCRSPTPAPKRGTKIDALDDLALGGIRRKIHKYFFNNEPPTIEKVLRDVNEDESLPYFKRTTFQKVLKKLKFKYVKRLRRSALIEKEEIQRWRFNYLRKIMSLREEGRKIYYLDETWVNEGQTKSKVWQDFSIESSRQAHMEGLSTGLKAPSGKGKCLIIVHIGNEDGFVEDGQLIFESKVMGTTIKKWTQKYLRSGLLTTCSSTRGPPRPSAPTRF
uniref:Tc1-like transposase DDE domain-containing protein n=1 Tax=Heliothis virescens TaxID=7102 RepID=A0A2A4IZ33_HELVI